jgi:hypothetical protein
VLPPAPRWQRLRAATRAEGGTVTVKVGGNVAGTWQRFAGSISPGTYRDQLVFLFRPTVVGNQPLDIEMARTRYIWSTGTPLMHIDNVSLRIVTDPVIRMSGERKQGLPVKLEVLGAANGAFALLVAPKAAAAPIPIPGWTGALGLDPATMIFFFAGALDGNGQFSVNLTPPIGLGGIPLFWQGAQIVASGKSLGLMAPINFY